MNKPGFQIHQIYQNNIGSISFFDWYRF